VNSEEHDVLTVKILSADFAAARKKTAGKIFAASRLFVKLLSPAFFY